MQISNDLKKYVKESILASNSNVIITDFEKVNYIETLYPNSVSNYVLSNALKELLHEWNCSQTNHSNLFSLLNGNGCIELIENEKLPYSCQLIFPIITRKGIEGSLILYRTHGNYVFSSINSVSNFKKFVEQFVDNAYDERNE